MRKVLVLFIVGSLGLLAGCGGGGSGTPVGVPTSISISPSVGQSITAGSSLSITASVITGSSSSSNGVTWTLAGPGSLSSSTANPVTYTAPTSVSSNKNVVVTATATADSTATVYLPLTVIPSGSASTANAQPITVGGAASGPAPYPNGLYTSVNVCVLGTTTCQTVDGILVDTGSFGLRILQSAMPNISLPVLTDTNNNTIFNCVSFADGSFLWGPVSGGDVRINGEVAGTTLLQVISSSSNGIPTGAGCGNGGENENTAQLLGANGILGIGPEPTDCSLAGVNFCDGSVQGAPPVYWACPSGGCGTNDSPITISAVDQVVNPVVLFSADNNGDMIQMPSLGASNTSAEANGTLFFGIGTQSNNGLGSANIYGLDTSDSFTTLFQGQTLTGSFIDSGSNGFFFPSSITPCSDNSFYCPPSIQNLQATNNGVSPPVSFSIDNADNLFANNPNNFAFATLGGPLGTPNTCSNGSGSCTFDFGEPFFYGRNVFTAIDGQNVPTATAPWFAY